jgi:tRNA(Ile)-lysidine synthase
LECDAVIVGVSGGPDSMCLLHLLKALQDDFEKRRQSTSLQIFPKIIAAHLHHGIRGAAADHDETLVREYCGEGGIPFHAKRINIEVAAKNDGMGLEEAGREARSAFFSELAALYSGEYPSVRIAVAHHREDRAETMLMNLFRGTGMDGLCAMGPRRNEIIRPLLFASREQIRMYVKTNEIPFSEDATNYENDFARNKWRNRILPLIREVSVKDPVDALLSTNELLCQDKLFFDGMISDLFDIHRVPVTQNNFGLPCSCLRENMPAISTRLVRHLFCERFSHTADLNFSQISRILMLSESGNGNKKISLSGGKIARIESDTLFFSEAAESGPDKLHEENYFGTDYMVLGRSWENEISVFGGNADKTGTSGKILHAFSLFSIEVILVENKGQVVYNNRTWYCPGDALAHVEVRTARPQDHITPAGRTSGKELRRFLTDRKVPSFIRGRVILFADQSEICWIPGVAHARGFVDEISCQRFIESNKCEELFMPGSLPIYRITILDTDIKEQI